MPVIDADAARARRAPDVREPPEEELRQALRLGGTRGDFLLPPVRRRHAGVFVRNRSLPVRSGGDGGRWLYVQEYAPPATVDRDQARARREEAISTLPEVTGLPADAIYWRTRRPQKGKSQYEAIADVQERDVVEEGGLKFLVNFTDYLDTGLFLDHRATRARIRAASKGKRFRTSSATPASRRCTPPRAGCVNDEHDMSRTYLDWASATSRSTGSRASTASCRKTALPGSRRKKRIVTTSSSRPADVFELQAHGPRVRRAA